MLLVSSVYLCQDWPYHAYSFCCVVLVPLPVIISSLIVEISDRGSGIPYASVTALPAIGLEFTSALDITRFVSYANGKCPYFVSIVNYPDSKLSVDHFTFSWRLIAEKTAPFEEVVSSSKQDCWRRVFGWLREELSIDVSCPCACPALLCRRCLNATPSHSAKLSIFQQSALYCESKVCFHLHK